MRALFLASRDWTHPQATGGDAQTCDFARYLASRGHQVTLVATRYPGSARAELCERVRILRLGGLFLLSLHAFLYYMKHRHEFDAVYEEGMASLRLPFLAPLYVRKPLVAMWYQINAPIFEEQYPRPLGRLLALAERVLLVLHKRCLLIAPSADRARDLLALGFRRELLRVVPPLMLDSRPDELPEREREPLVVWLGKIRRYKCAHHAIEAMAHVARSIANARLVIAGRRDDQAYETELLEQARKLGIGRQVEVVADLTDAQKWDLLSRAQALVVTSPVEGFSIVIIEANRCGTPVVVTEGVPNDTAQEGVNAIRVPFGDTQAMAQALLRVLGDREFFETLSSSSRRHAEQFSVEETGRRLEETFAAAAARAA